MRLKTAVARGVTAAVQRLPRGLTTPLAATVGTLLWAGFDRRVANENLARVYPQWSSFRRRRTAYRSYKRMARALVEFLHTRKYSREEILARVTLDNERALDTALERGRGAILLSGHFGNWEWLARRVAAAGHPFAVLFKEPGDPVLAERLRAIRASAGIEQIDHDDMRAAVRWLRKGRVLGIVMDQEPRRSAEGVVAPLFGHPTMTHVGPFRLARMSGAPLLTFFCRAAGRGRYHARLEPLAGSDVADPEAAVAQDAARFNARLEAAVRASPEHWMWMYRRWARIDRRARSGQPADARLSDGVELSGR
ncbi:MAG TPA: lysophospholipid acyltransferase family protein [Gemmatimonadota bacterium]|nr:lysophospholipid acyltransferase family protein [Gemmatimonadota bacterium]